MCVSIHRVIAHLHHILACVPLEGVCACACDILLSSTTSNQLINQHEAHRLLVASSTLFKACVTVCGVLRACSALRWQCGKCAWALLSPAAFSAHFFHPSPRFPFCGWQLPPFDKAQLLPPRSSVQLLFLAGVCCGWLREIGRLVNVLRCGAFAVHALAPGSCSSVTYQRQYASLSG